MQALVMLTTRVVQSPRITTHALLEPLQKTIGFWIHHCMYQRASLCLFQESYRWIEEGKHHPHVPRVLPAFVRQEFQGAILLYPLIRSDLASCLNPDLYASDATQEVGAVIKAKVCLSDMVLAWSRRTHHLSPGHAVLEESQLYKLDREERKDRLWEQLVARQRFSLVAKYQFSSPAHINVKELMAARTALRHVVEDPKKWQTRTLIAVDSQVAVWAMRKGRSSSRALNQVLQTMVGDALSTGTRLCPVWIATECNPADAPTRKRRIPPPEEPGPEYFHRKREVLREHPWTLALNRHEWEERFEQVSIDFDSTLGYPGEGPRAGDFARR
eukprot:531986-Amphidinium_carterae.1